MSLLKLIIFTLAFIGLGTAIYSFQQVGTWLNNTGYDEIGYPLRSRDVNMLGWRTRHPIPKAGSTTRAP